MIINVTEEEIREGLQHSAKSCPIALAIKKALHLTDLSFYNSVSVCWTSMIINGKNLYTPQVASDFILKFDKDKFGVEPFSFELELEV